MSLVQTCRASKTAPASQGNPAGAWKVKDARFAPEKLSSLSRPCVAVNPFLPPSVGLPFLLLFLLVGRVEPAESAP